MIPVLLFVEGEDDVPMWTEAVKPYRSKYDIRVVTNKAVNPEEENGKTKLLTMHGLCCNKLVAVDADYDLLVDNYSNYTNDVRAGQFVVNTTWYSVENILFQKTDKIPLLESFSSAAYDMFIHHIAKIVNGTEKSPVKNFGKMLVQLNVQNDFEQIIDDRYHKKSLIISSQLPVADWYGVFSIDIFATLTQVAEYHRNRWPTIARNKQFAEELCGGGLPLILYITKTKS